MKFHVRYYLMMQGMLEPDLRDYGIVDACDAQLAKEQIADKEGYYLGLANTRANKVRDFFIGCLHAEEV